jgi:hypothetical protein
MNKRCLGRQREDRILVAEEEILHETENQPRKSTRGLANNLGVSQFVVWLRAQNASQEICQNRGFLNRVRFAILFSFPLFHAIFLSFHISFFSSSHIFFNFLSCTSLII